MRKGLLSAAAIALAATTFAAAPAMANEARVEARGGVIWNGSDSEAIAGVAAGYDVDVGQKTFVGVEVSGDKILTDHTRVSFGASARAGAKLGEAGKLYAVGGYATKPCRFCEDSFNLGAGYQHNFGRNFYGKVEYRHNFIGDGVKDNDVAGVGLGVRF
ncbi:YfaZ family protein [Caenibius sp. WL]|uniref:outer membrane protein n=1 Tax=Caenibius sp. WL TaxID=2872646 RepID=UPI001C993977|nr:YfaZ family protein [Caenibius sp. WL]QZP06866.1 YfaZ family protein [Caenibius sp. WL]